jgi:hypothetical protein
MPHIVTTILGQQSVRFARVYITDISFDHGGNTNLKIYRRCILCASWPRALNQKYIGINYVGPRVLVHYVMNRSKSTQVRGYHTLGRGTRHGRPLPELALFNHYLWWKTEVRYLGSLLRPSVTSMHKTDMRDCRLHMSLWIYLSLYVLLRIIN